MSLEPGQSLGPYKVATLLGEGGIGQVWQATDTQLNREARCVSMGETETLTSPCQRQETPSRMYLGDSTTSRTVS